METEPSALTAEIQLSEGCYQAQYFPLSKGVYEVTPGLMAFGTDLGNGAADRQLFQVDDHYAPYRRAKLEARAEALDKYYATHQYPPAVAGAVAAFVARRLAAEHPETFVLRQDDAGFTLQCTPSREVLRFDRNWALTQARPRIERGPDYASALDALVCQVQEDLAVICRRGDSENWLAALHLCFPNHWAAAEKIGKDFAAVHAPVPGIERLTQRSQALVDAMIDRGPYVRFVWGLSTDTRLNHHPQAPGELPQWHGRRFDPQDPHLFLRVERQVTWGLPECDAALFAIRTYFADAAEVRRDPWRRDKLCSALRSMSAAAQEYKGIAANREAALHWLQGGD
jgi:hypothetical protein